MKINNDENNERKINKKPQKQKSIKNKKNESFSSSKNITNNEKAGERFFIWLNRALETRIRYFRNITILVCLVFILILSVFSVQSYIVNYHPSNSGDTASPLQKMIKTVFPDSSTKNQGDIQNSNINNKGTVSNNTYNQ